MPELSAAFMCAGPMLADSPYMCASSVLAESQLALPSTAKGTKVGELAVSIEGIRQVPGYTTLNKGSSYSQCHI